jgi:osmotically-inducible protein OsmY
MKIAKAVLALVVAGVCPVVADVPRDLAQAVRESYIFRTVLYGNVDVSATSGAVTLTGTVPDEKYRWLAEDTARATPGVTTVVNQVAVRPTVAEKSDEWIRLQFNNKLLLSRHLGPADIRASVQNGIITLEGTTADLVQKYLAEIFAKQIPGVTEVRNNLAADKLSSGHIDDPSLKGLVTFALRTHSPAQVQNIEVVPRDGEVTLNGTVPSALHKDIVTSLAESLPGVKEVTNNLATPS